MWIKNQTVFYIPADKKLEAIILPFPLKNNINLTNSVSQLLWQIKIWILRQNVRLEKSQSDINIDSFEKENYEEKAWRDERQKTWHSLSEKSFAAYFEKVTRGKFLWLQTSSSKIVQCSYLNSKHCQYWKCRKQTKTTFLYSLKKKRLMNFHTEQFVVKFMISYSFLHDYM